MELGTYVSMFNQIVEVFIVNLLIGVEMSSMVIIGQLFVTRFIFLCFFVDMSEEDWDDVILITVV